MNGRAGAREWSDMSLGLQTPTDAAGTAFLVGEVFDCGRHFEFSPLP